MKKRKIPRRLQRLVSERAYSCCEYCISQEAYSPDPFSTEHIVPEILGGANAEDNLARACQGCNNFKHTKTTSIDPITLQEVPLFYPRRDVWEEHFVHIALQKNDFYSYFGLSLNTSSPRWRHSRASNQRSNSEK